MRKWLPVQLGVCLVLACALALVAILWPNSFVDPVYRFCGVAAVAMIAVFCIVNAVPESLYQVWLGLNTDITPVPPAEQVREPKEKSVRPPSCEELQSVEVQTLLMELDSEDDWTATLALHALNERFGQPFMPIECWPCQTTTRLKRIAAEVLFREWLEIVTDIPGADDDEIVDRMFPVIIDKKSSEPKPRRFRKLREMKYSVLPLRPPFVIRKLDEWSETVKNAVMDINIGEPAGDELLEGEDKALLPFDRQQFLDTMTDRMQESLDFIADTVAEANTDYELLCNQRKIEPYLTNMSWEAIAVALEQRQAEPALVKADEVRRRVEEMPTRWLPSQPLLAQPTEGWARKYRRMKAQGL